MTVPKPDKKVISLIRQRFKRCRVVEFDHVPMEFKREKVLGRQTSDGSDNILQAFIKWLKFEWDGSKIGVKEIKDKFEISDKYWSKISSHPVVRDIKSSRKVGTKRDGKGNNQVYYWYI